MIGNIITINDKKWIIFELWGDFDEYFCITDFETQTINELVPKANVKETDIQECNVEWLFLKRRQKNLAGLEKYI